MSTLYKKTKLNDDAQVMLDGYKGHEDVPENVTHIRFHPSAVKVEMNGFSNCNDLIEVVLNDGLREIGNSAFRDCKALQEITVPFTVTQISTYAFHDCSNLREVVLNDGVREIGNYAFNKCHSLRSINIPSTVTEIGKGAFSYCTNLREVVLNEGLQKIDNSAFYLLSSCLFFTKNEHIMYLSSNYLSSVLDTLYR